MPSHNKIAVSKHVIYGLVLVTIVAIAAVTWFLIAGNNQDKANNVEIIQFTKLPAEDRNNGYMYWPFTVKLQNQGSSDVSGLTLVIRMLGNDDSELGRCSEQFSTLHSGDERTITTGITLGYNVGLGKMPGYYTATLKLGEIVLDESRLP